jgi:peptidoglycan/xylan/chitin deacetylase (PgdA/CDA1 family)
MLSWQMIREMSDYGIDFQSHTASHPHLPLIPDDQIKAELKESRKKIESQLGKPCNILCYPYNEFDERVVEIVKKEGYLAALAGQESADDLYSLRRVGSAQINTLLGFKTALKGTFPIYSSIKRKIYSFAGRRK